MDLGNIKRGIKKFFFSNPLPEIIGEIKKLKFVSKLEVDIRNKRQGLMSGGRL